METIKISINNWEKKYDYPETGFFYDNYDKTCDGWGNLFTDEYCEENKICAIFGTVDMSENITLVAPKEWVDKNCPEILTNELYHKRFVYDNDANEDRFGQPFAKDNVDYGVDVF